MRNKFVVRELKPSEPYLRPVLMNLFSSPGTLGLQPDFVAADPEVPGSIPGATRFSE
jgi:hypothetical protein